MVTCCSIFPTVYPPCSVYPAQRVGVQLVQLVGGVNRITGWGSDPQLGTLPTRERRTRRLTRTDHTKGAV